ncbi:MAG: DUF86 domain-containing protein [Armatimonadetes bacterium]|nr:DUF86 domain-containing protein [Armatimonadota bacterium]
MRREVLYLRDVEDACRKVIARTASVERAAFFSDDLLYDAVIRRLEIIGEAVKQLPESITSRRPDIEWQQIGRFRDKVAHHYFGLDEDIIWEVVSAKVPELLAVVVQILAEEVAE